MSPPSFFAAALIIGLLGAATLGYAFNAAARLRAVSDGLTRMARNYAVTGDARYRELYEHIVRVRDGKAPRPFGDSPAHWDLLLAGIATPKVQAFGLHAQKPAQ